MLKISVDLQLTFNPQRVVSASLIEYTTIYISQLMNLILYFFVYDEKC